MSACKRYSMLSFLRLAWAATLALAMPVLVADEPNNAIRISMLHYGINAQIPVLAGEGPAIEQANARLRGRVEALVDAFVKEHREMSTEEPGGAPPGQPWSLEIGHSEPYRTTKLAAVRLNGYDFRGGAHGMPVIETLVVDLADGRLLAAADLFRPGSDWPAILSDRSRAALTGRDLLGPDWDWLQRGTAPERANYQHLMPGADGLTVIFPPYQVAPYAAGPQEVLVPWTDLTGLLNPALFGD